MHFLWLAGGLGHCGHLHLLMWVGPRLDPETGRFLHRRILQHYGGLGLMSLLYWAVTHIRLPDPIDNTVYYTGPRPCADGEYMSRRCLFVRSTRSPARSLANRCNSSCLALQLELLSNIESTVLLLSEEILVVDRTFNQIILLHYGC